ncbi:hypothetical protein CDL15_Pgr020481 [Punica granatum]|uniref:Uncharacterized protein n=1 Tax=Punica granatum TaxID=22663 RepID=A0A218VVD4_PUNGR|nr:hypothetical protein CDL15_Pgr020481 [Punica granatum]PKI33779.1 hypothetical protein CRG98_045830 [Punica granatum]
MEPKPATNKRDKKEKTEMAATHKFDPNRSNRNMNQSGRMKLEDRVDPTRHITKFDDATAGRNPQETPEI